MYHYIVWAFACLIRLYPLEFQEEYGEELQGVFQMMLKDATQGGKRNFLVFCFRELRDVPVNLLRAHLEKKHMLKVLHSQPVRFAWRGALGFGLAFVVVNPLAQLINDALLSFEFNHIALFLDKQYQQMFFLGDDILSWMVASLIGGLLFAALFARRSQFWRFTVLGILGWLIPGLVYRGLKYSIYGNSQLFYWASEALSGLFLGWVIGLATEARSKKFVLAVVGTLLYPVLAECFAYVIWTMFPPASSLVVRPFEVYRNVTLILAVAGITFGIVMGLILGWGKKRKPSSPSG
jgi:hypothetical protein